MTLFLLVGSTGAKKSQTWENINSQVKKYIFVKFITSSVTGIIAGLYIGLLDWI